MDNSKTPNPDVSRIKQNVESMITQNAPRPRGRPKGAKNKPKTLGQFIAQAIRDPYAPPAKAPKGRKGGAGIWATMKTPEERSAYAKWIRSKVTPEGLSRTGRKAGSPNGWRATDYALAEERAEKDVKFFLKHMEESGQLPKNPIAREATVEALKIIRSPCSKSLRLAVARTLLTYFLPAPVRAATAKPVTAEDLIDQMDKEASQPPAVPMPVQASMFCTPSVAGGAHRDRR